MTHISMSDGSGYFLPDAGIPTGELTIPNVGLGDIRITFNDQSPDEVDKAIKMLTDMQKRGYAILVQLEDGTYARAESIDASRKVYIIGDYSPSPTVETTDAAEVPKRGRRPKRELPIASTKAVGVARSAGG